MSCKKCDKRESFKFAERKIPFVYKGELFHYVDDWEKVPVDYCPYCGEDLKAAQADECAIEELDPILESMFSYGYDDPRMFFYEMGKAVELLGSNLDEVFEEEENSTLAEYLAWRESPRSPTSCHKLCGALVGKAAAWFGVDKPCSVKQLQEWFPE